MTDALESWVALADGSGTVQTTYTYEPFGKTTTSGAGTTNSFGFTGREADGTGLHYYRARYYDARLQRFIGEDPLGFGAGDVNLHAYVGNAPVDLVDPTGEMPLLALPVAGCFGGAAGSALFHALKGRNPRFVSWWRRAAREPFWASALGQWDHWWHLSHSCPPPERQCSSVRRPRPWRERDIR
jgi:RHS repeat-associated protein